MVLIIRSKGRWLGFDKQKKNLILLNVPPSAEKWTFEVQFFLRTYSKENTFAVFPHRSSTEKRLPACLSVDCPAVCNTGEGREGKKTYGGEGGRGERVVAWGLLRRFDLCVPIKGKGGKERVTVFS